MTSDSALPEVVTGKTPATEEDVVAEETPATEEAVKVNLQVRFKSEADRLLLILPTEAEFPSSADSWSELWQQMKHRLNAGDRFWQPNTKVELFAVDRLLDARQLQAIADALTQAQLQMQRVHTSRRQTAVAAATAGYCVEQQAAVSTLERSPAPAVAPLVEPLYLQMTIRSGVEIRHSGTVIVLGDINPGGIVVAKGDILVWGRLRGVAHAGADGNAKCLIMALQMEPTQLRIADSLARAPASRPERYEVEVAYITPDGIRISKAADFSKSQFLPQS
ncbi:septum site-determining protein MinC [Aliterella atlantica]|uniref:Probable septum site-determining protein MinC n=1 Tax=Aliterella atlantica CENA595 TaxID=1618023 RepID=A0A0D8ZZJ0_9CYAN|nr:septum site-determining protein MinC [Aliterella atlantica]KJH72651.1 septation ring formation regulator EzrA [Aliterella atlantica CENA595]